MNEEVTEQTKAFGKPSEADYNRFSELALKALKVTEQTKAFGKLSEVDYNRVLKLSKLKYSDCHCPSGAGQYDKTK